MSNFADSHLGFGGNVLIDPFLPCVGLITSLLLGLYVLALEHVVRPLAPSITVELDGLRE